MTEALIERLSKAKTGDEADVVLTEARNTTEEQESQLTKLMDKHVPGDVKMHGEFQKLFASHQSTAAILEVLSDDPERSFFWHLGNVAINQDLRDESDYAKLLRVDGNVRELGFAVQAIFALIKRPEILKAIAHLMEAKDAPKAQP